MAMVRREKGRRPKKKICSFCVDKITDIDYKEVPKLRRYITEVAEAGLVPMVYVEGSYNSRLDYLTEVPKGKVVYLFETTDMKAAKAKLGGHSCIAGDVPNVMLSHGTPQEVADHCKWLIDTCAPGGGYMMDSGALIDEAKPENVAAMFETTMTYGRAK
jgi:uroporphyrinogen-III decarboxylase